MTFSPTEAAFEGFRITREKPRAVLAWAALYLAVNLFIAWLAIAMVGPDFAALQAAAKSASPDVEATFGNLRKLAPFLALAVPIMLAVNAVLICAVYRVVLRPQERGMEYLKIGGDELRMAGLILVLASLGLGVVFVTGLAVGIITAVLGLIGGLAPLIDVLAALAALGVVLWGAVRLSLAGPLTFATREIHVFRSWPLTRGQFWPLLGTYVIAWAMGFVVMLVAAVMFAALLSAVILATGGSIETVGKLMQPDTSSVATFFTPAMLLSQVFSAVLRTVFFTVVLAPPAMAYAALAGRPEAETFA